MCKEQKWFKIWEINLSEKSVASKYSKNTPSGTWRINDPRFPHKEKLRKWRIITIQSHVCLKGCEQLRLQGVAKSKFQPCFTQGSLCTPCSALNRIIKLLGPGRIHSEVFWALIWDQTLFPVVSSANTAMILC